MKSEQIHLGTRRNFYLMLRLMMLVPARVFMIVLKTRKTLVRLSPAATLTLIMILHLHLCAECLMLSMGPPGHHHHHLHLGDCLDCGVAGV